MAETTVIEQSLPEVLLLPVRGACAVQYYELYDEVAHGADNLYIRGRFSTIVEVADYVHQVLASSNPCDISPATNNYALGRYNRYMGNHTLLDRDPADTYPDKAFYAFRLMLRIKFYSDCAYIEFGKKWNPLRLPDGSINPSYPIEKGKQTNGYRFDINSCSLLNLSMIAKDDAEHIMNVIVGGGSQTVEFVPDEEMTEEDFNAVEDTVSSIGDYTASLMSQVMSIDDDGTFGAANTERIVDPNTGAETVEASAGDDKQLGVYTYVNENGEVLYVKDLEEDNPDQIIIEVKNDESEDVPQS